MIRKGDTPTVDQTQLKAKRTRLIALISAGAVLIIALGILIGGKLSGILFNGQELFKPTETPAIAIATPSAKATESPEGTPAPTEVPSPSPTMDPYEELLSKADTSMMHNIVNIMLIGVDYEDARVEDSWSGKKGNAFHSDVMIVAAVNFDEKKVDLISIPRDTYGKIPGVDGIYKLNASLNCGTDGTNYGLYCENGEGFLKVCETAEWMLGGIDVDYYYAVTMESVKELIDAVGGVEYDLEGDFDNGGRYYKKGLQHMDGQACLDYMRVRKGGHGDLATGDGNRVQRQKNMLVALFKTMQEKNLITSIPAILSAVTEGVYTNCSAEQTAALAAFAYGLDAEDIGMYSFSGSSATLFHWNFVFTDQGNRTKLIKQIYNVDVSRHNKYTLGYARYYWASLLIDDYIDLCEGLADYVEECIEEDNKLLDVTPEPTETPEPTPIEGQNTPLPVDTEEPAPEPDPTEPPEAPETPAPMSEGVVLLSAGLHRSEVDPRKYTDYQRNLYYAFLDTYNAMLDCYEDVKKEANKSSSGKSNSLSTYASELIEWMEAAQAQAIELAKEFGYDEVKNFTTPCGPTATYRNCPWSFNYWDKKSFNEITVNFN